MGIGAERSTIECAKSREARRRIAELETELAAPKRASKLSIAIVDCIDGFYNRRVRHSSPGDFSPAEFEKRQHKLTAA